MKMPPYVSWRDKYMKYNWIYISAYMNKYDNTKHLT